MDKFAKASDSFEITYIGPTSFYSVQHSLFHWRKMHFMSKNKTSIGLDTFFCCCCSNYNKHLYLYYVQQIAINYNKFRIIGLWFISNFALKAKNYPQFRHREKNIHISESWVEWNDGIAHGEKKELHFQLAWWLTIFNGRSEICLMSAFNWKLFACETKWIKKSRNHENHDKHLVWSNLHSDSYWNKSSKRRPLITYIIRGQYYYWEVDFLCNSL